MKNKNLIIGFLAVLALVGGLIYYKKKKGTTESNGSTPAATVHPYEGKLIQYDREPAVYIVKDGKKRPFGFPESVVRTTGKTNWREDVNYITKEELDAIPTGAQIV
jgi:hypothetical protein